MVLFKKSLPGITVTRNPDWSAEIDSMVRDRLRKKERYYHLLNVLPEADCIAGFVINC